MDKVQVISVKPISQSSDENSIKAAKIKTPDHSLLKSEVLQNNDRGSKAKTLSFISRGGASFSKTSKSGDPSLESVSESSQTNHSQIKKYSNKEGNTGYGSDRFRSSGSSRSGFSFPTSSTNCFGRSDFRASYNERIRSGSSSLQQFGISKERISEQRAGNDFVYMKGSTFARSGLHRSNSSLELDHELIEEPNQDALLLRREYGSHGSINVAAANQQQDSLYTILQSYQDTKQDRPLSSDSISPKVKYKIRLFDKEKSSIFKKFRQNKASDSRGESKADSTSSEISVSLTGIVISNTNAKSPEVMETDSKSEDSPMPKIIRRSAFAHYDCQSLAAQLSAIRLRALLADRSNTLTGASAAAMADPSSPQHVIHNNSEELLLEDADRGDGRSNHLVSSCPFFHNEVGGDGERIISLGREVCRSNRIVGSNSKAVHLHRSVCASSIGLLEPSNSSSHWGQSLCPYVNRSPTLEAIDQGSSFYTTSFQNQEHQNWFGIDDTLGPVAISIKREKLEESGFDKNHSLPCFQYRLIVRTSELFTCQGTIREEILNQRGEKGKGLGVREAVEYVCPQLSLSCLRLGTTAKETEDVLIKLDELGIQNKFKVGVLYCRSGQKTEEEMYSNEHAGPAFSEFLEILGQRVRLKNFEKYRGGLDKNTDSTGHYSVYACHQGCEIMFHVSTLLPFSSNSNKQLLRKRHIGNDIVTIIFQEPGALPFSPKNIRSHFMHIFIIVQAVNPCTDNTMYSIAVSRFQDVPMFGPPIPEGATFPKSKKFTQFLLAKIINGQIAALRSDKFAAMATRTKHEYLKDLATNHCTTTSLDTSSKFSLIGFSRASRKEKCRFKFVSDSSVRGALSWNICIHDATLQQNVDCIVAISADSVVVLEESTSSVIFATACKSILGWTVKPGQGLLMFYHQGECLIVNLRPGTTEAEGEEIVSEIVSRLSAVTQGAESQELVLRRNSAGLLGFNVQQDGIITEVELYGLAAKAGLKQGARLVEICTVALATLCQEQMVDLLKTSMTVTVTVIPPHKDGTPRKGCNVPTCSFLLGCSEGDYENLTPPEKISKSHTKHRVKELTRCDRSLSPPRSGNSSGYGTGSSSHSFSLEAAQGNKIASVPYHESGHPEEDAAAVSVKEKYTSCQPCVDHMKYDYTGTLSSTSSGHSNDRWSEATPDDLSLPQTGGLCNVPVFPNQRNSPLSQGCLDPSPPPLPARAFQTSRDQNISAVAHSKGSSYKAAHGSDGKSSPFGRNQSPYHAPYPCSFEQGNYAVPPPLPRPVHREYFENRVNKSDMTNCDYDNTLDAPEVTLNYNLKQNFRRNSSPQPTEVRDGDGAEAHSKSMNCLKSRHSIPKNLSEEGKALDDHLTVSRSEDELSASSGSSPHGFQRVRSSASNSSPSLSSRTHSPHGSNPNPIMTKDTPAVVRLKQSAASSKHSGHRNSGSYSNSNLQDELLKLINPDYISDSDNMNMVTEKRHQNCAFTEVELRKSNEKLLTCRSDVGTADDEGLEEPCASFSHLSTGIYECPSAVYQTIGEAEFSNRKSVFTKAPPDKGVYINLDKVIDCEKPTEVPTRKPLSSEGVVLTARPATVISNSSTASSPAPLQESKDKTPFDPSGQIKEKETFHVDPPTERYVNEMCPEGQSRTAQKPPPFKPTLVADLEEEWCSLVHTATRAIEKSSDAPAPASELMPERTHIQDVNANPTNPEKEIDDPLKCNTLSVNNNINKDTSRSSSQASYYSMPRDLEALKNSAANKTNCQTISEDPDLKERRISHLEEALASEQQRSGHLEEQVSILRSENIKLQQDSRAAAHQLHQFTEWFFNTIDKG